MSSKASRYFFSLDNKGKREDKVNNCTEIT